MSSIRSQSDEAAQLSNAANSTIRVGEKADLLGSSRKLKRSSRLVQHVSGIDTHSTQHEQRKSQPDKQTKVVWRSPIAEPEEIIDLQAPSCDYEFLDNGGVLKFSESASDRLIEVFRAHWRKAAPVIITGCQRQLNTALWSPESFCMEYGNRHNELVDCTNDLLLIGHRMRVFWSGFESIQGRLCDENGQRIILKLKDWPPKEDIAELMPERFKNLLEALPLPQYTHRTGIFNLVSRLPDFFVRPDLGPKLYLAYGSSLYPHIGSTNLHLDISDAANLMLYVGVPGDDAEVQERAAIEAMRQAGCCQQTMARVLANGELPGALWHIYDPNDSDKIRTLLTAVAREKGEIFQPHHDPIHDQSWYLDEELRERLWQEHAVRGYTVVQFYGDTVFIPAGAAHQVRNLHSCIKAAEDFVSPENLSHCLTMTQQFRHLSDTHSNHEDKLQIKNIIYHTVKDAVAALEGS